MATIQAAPAMTLFLIDGAGLLFIDMICGQATICPAQSCQCEDQGVFRHAGNDLGIAIGYTNRVVHDN